MDWKHSFLTLQSFFKRNNRAHASQGFTFIELTVIIAIFSIMAAVTLGNYGAFNKRIKLNSLTQDLALVLRRAQTYGISASSDINNPTATASRFGVHFETQPSGTVSTIQLYKAPGGLGSTVYGYVPGSVTLIDNLTISDPDIEVGVCSLSSGPGICPAQTITLSSDVEFERPNPEPIVSSNTGATSELMLRVRRLSDIDNPMYIVVGTAGNIYVRK